MRGGEMKKIIVFIVVSFMLVNIYGCLALAAGAAAGAGTKGWLDGKSTQNVKASYERAIEAVKKALKSLELKVTKEIKTANVTQIKSKYTDGREIWIDLHPVTESSTDIEVRVGIRGDKEAAENILSRINRYL